MSSPASSCDAPKAALPRDAEREPGRLPGMAARAVATLSLLAIVGTAAPAVPAVPVVPPVAAEQARVAFRWRDPRIAESSGLAAATREPGVWFTHNDSG